MEKLLCLPPGRQLRTREVMKHCCRTVLWETASQIEQQKELCQAASVQFRVFKAGSEEKIQSEA